MEAVCVPLIVFWSFLLICAHSNAGIGVDVHVHRITNRLGWLNPATKAPEETRCVSRLLHRLIAAS